LLTQLAAVIWKQIPGGVLTKIILAVSSFVFSWATSIYLTGTRFKKGLDAVNTTLLTVNETLSTNIETLSTKIDAVNETLSLKIDDLRDNLFSKSDIRIFGVVLLCAPAISRILPFTINVAMKPGKAHSPSPPPSPPPVASAVP